MAVIKRKDTTSKPWQARWSDRDGKIHTKHFRIKAEAVSYEALQRTEVARGLFSDPQKAKTKLIRVYENWLLSTTNLKPKTRASYESLWKCLIEPEWGNRQLQNIDRSEIRTWLIARKSSTGRIVSGSRMKQAYVLFKLLLDHAVDMNLIRLSPILTGSKSNLKNILPKKSIEDTKRILQYSELLELSNAVGEYGPLILLAGLVGPRWAELVALTPGDFDFKAQTISINKSMTEINGRFELITPKSGQSRLLPIPKTLVTELRSLVLATDPFSPVFRAPHGGYLRHSNFSRRLFKPALSALEITDFTFHNLRHTAISHAIASGVDVLAISKIAGHSNPAITLNVYGHLINNSLDNYRIAMDKNFASASNR